MSRGYDAAVRMFARERSLAVGLASDLGGEDDPNGCRPATSVGRLERFEEHVAVHALGTPPSSDATHSI